MHILIDRETMNVLYKHQSAAVLSNLAHIEVAHTSTTIADNHCWHLFTDLELKLLYENLTGSKYVGYARDILVHAIKHLVDSIAPNVLNGFEVAVQAAQIPLDNKLFYKYAPGSKTASTQNVLFTPKALQAHAGAVSTLPPTPIPSAAPSAGPQAAAPIPMRSSAPVSKDAPKAGSKTGRVWELCESWYEQLPAPCDFKELGRRVKASGEAEGINGSTLSVQISAWKKTKL
jgi:hypothetical protein